jgi:methyl-accepting chemotaxis protein
MVIIGFFCYKSYRDRNVEAKAGYALSYAKTLASIVDADKLMELMASGVKTDYWHSIKYIIDKAYNEANLSYLYIVLPYDEDNYIYFAEGEPADGSDEALDFMTIESKDNYLEETDEIIKSGADYTTDIYDSGDYGMVVTGYSVIHDGNGRPIAIAGADISADDIQADSNAFLMEIFAAILASAIIVVLITVIYIRRKLTKPLGNIVSVFSDLSSGIVNRNYFSGKRQDNEELRMLGQSADNMAESIDSLIRGVNNMTEEQRAGNTDAYIETDTFNGSYKTLALGINSMADDSARESAEIIDCLKSFGKGDFSTKLRPLPGKKRAVNDAIETLRENLININKDITSMAVSAAKGDLSARIDEEQFIGDWNDLVSHLNELLDAIGRPVDESSEVLEKISRGVLDTQVTGQYEGAFARIKTALNNTSNELSDYIGEIKTVLNEMADSNLSVEITREYIGQFIEIKEAINNILDKQNMIIRDIHAASDQVSDGASILADSSQKLMMSSNGQIQAVDTLNTVAAQINDGAEKNERDAGRANDLIALSKENADNGNREMTKLTEAMVRIKTSSDDISRIVRVIDDIASQTNLLAVNAAVEAAHAGERGKGFAVVAEQVRVLAKRSQNAVKETSGLIGQSMASVNEGTELTRSTASLLETISSSISDVSDIMMNIAESSKTQLRAADDIIKELESMTESVRSNSEEALKSSALSEELAARAVELKEKIGEFRLKADEVSDGEIQTPA